jgi:hypothetical protein
VRSGDIDEIFINTMKILCLGNNTEDTDLNTRKISSDQNLEYHGLLSELEGKIFVAQYQKQGTYHTSIYDIEFGRLVDIGNQFDLVIMLDQSVETWSHPDAFYNTVRIMKSLAVPTQFLNQSFSSTIDYFTQFVDQNKSFCAFPFIELLVDRGNTTVCCRSSTPVVPIDQLFDYQSDIHYQTIREKMLRGERIPKHCQSCYDLEKLGVRSARQQETVEWANRLQFKTIDDFKKIQKPVYYEIRASNKCNLQCRMCGPENSHLIDREYRKIGLVERQRPLSRKFGGGFDIVDFANLKKLYVAGGEPLIMAETYEFLNRCVQENNTDFELLINTNGTKLSGKLKKLISNFRNLQFILSIDAYESLNHYIRWPSDWNTIINNWRYLRNNGHKVIINTTVSIYNIHRLHELYQFIDQHFPGTLTHCCLVEFPRCLSPWLFPEKKLVLNSLNLVRQTSCYKNDPLFTSSIDGYLQFFMSESKYNQSTLDEFFKFNDLLDQSRSIRLVDYDPVLDSYRRNT